MKVTTLGQYLPSASVGSSLPVGKTAYGDADLSYRNLKPEQCTELVNKP